MREILHLQAGQCGNQIGAKVTYKKKNKKHNTHGDCYFENLTAGFSRRPRPVGHAVTNRIPANLLPLTVIIETYRQYFI